ncbi:PREDICTED: uncharacterized protein LOC109190372 isoform X2 [Ipomoea nil]|uniref:uncharacterized protein LOC109190372 isoform X2 n=1 Tax=Ipomoea nil TaxID=35883 RepID=UPI0009016EBD|nr:PREDICTED: uncharacterized protein LOC109190372 isoform X2 [Ipomoea nil]
MRARLVVFPIKGRNWCFSRSLDRSACEAQSSNIPSTFVELWSRISKPAKDKLSWYNLELLIDFAANKMSNQWCNLEKAPAGSFKSKIHGLGLWMLSGVKPSEIFLKSITKEVNRVEIIYPSSLNGLLVRRRLRHIAFRGTIIHKKYLYGSASLLPLTTVFMVLPFPNIPFFWILFRTYSHWRALQGSEKLLRLTSNFPNNQNSKENTIHTNRSTEGKYHNHQGRMWF